MIKLAWVFEIEGDADYRRWSGDGTLTWSGKEYEGGVGLETDGISLSLDRSPPPATVTIGTDSTAERSFWSTVRGYPLASLTLLYDDGDGWEEGPKLRGRLGQPRLADEAVEVDVEPLPLSALPIEPDRWDHETQQAEFPGDQGFAFLEAWENNRSDLGWPR